MNRITAEYIWEYFIQNHENEVNARESLINDNTQDGRSILDQIGEQSENKRCGMKECLDDLITGFFNVEESYYGEEFKNMVNQSGYGYINEDGDFIEKLMM